MVRIFTAILILMIVGLQFRLWVGEGSLAETAALEERVGKAGNENLIKSNRNRILRAEIIELKNGLDSIEERARSELGMIKTGETFYLLVDESNDDSQK